MLCTDNITAMVRSMHASWQTELILYVHFHECLASSGSTSTVRSDCGFGAVNRNSRATLGRRYYICLPGLL